MPPPVPYLTKMRQGTVERLASLPVFKGVYDSRLPQLKRELLPAVRVYTTSQNMVGLSLSIPDFRTTAHLLVQIVCEDITDALIAERIDRYVEIVKARLLTDGEWLQLFERVLSIDTDVERNIEGESRLTYATLDFAVQYTCAWETYVPDWLESLDIRVDVIDPAADPNTGPFGTPPNVEGGYRGGYPGPDGRIEVDARFLNPNPPSQGGDGALQIPRPPNRREH